MVYHVRNERRFKVMVPHTIQCGPVVCLNCGYQSSATLGARMCSFFGPMLKDGRRCEECLQAEEEPGVEVEHIPDWKMRPL